MSPPKAEESTAATRASSDSKASSSAATSPHPGRASSSTATSPHTQAASPDDARAPSQDTTPGRPAKRARTSTVAAGSAASVRGVANLTPEQLAKKRANDREAQRAIRERTKTQIETLEGRIAELTAQQPYQELQTALREKERVEQENAEIRRRLRTVVGILTPLLDSGAVNGISTSGPLEDANAVLTHAFGTTSEDPYTPSSSTTTGRPYASAPWSNGMPATGPEGPAAVPQHQPQYMNNVPDMHHVRQGRPPDAVSSILRTTSAERMALGLMPGREPATQPHAPLLPPEGRRISLPSDSHITLDTSPAAPDDDPHSASSSAHDLYRNPTAYHPPADAYHASYDAYASHGYAPHPTVSSSALPMHTGAYCTLDGILLDFLAERRRLLAAGDSPPDVAGPLYPDFTYFMLPPALRRARRAQHPLSQLLTDVILTFPDIHASPEKVATFLGMYRLLRWLGHPTAAHYAAILPFARPTPGQLLTPHPVWHDTPPWPSIRDALVRHAPVGYPFDEFFVPFTKTLSVNWRGGDEAVWRNPPPGADAARDGGLVLEPGQVLEIAPRFEEHVSDLRNWSLGTAFVKAFPGLAGKDVRIEDGNAE